VLTVTDKPLVSSDVLRNPYGAIVDLNLTRVVGGELVKLMVWYDNEWGYTSMLVKHVISLIPFIERT
jgi:glyceraldehyde 3-phosphate dehydrogenase